MLILGIESSCDDTSVALVESSGQGCFVVSEGTISQIDIHKKYGGVVPEVAGRMHAEKIVPLIEQVLTNQPHPDCIAVTSGPGLVTGLVVGVEAARALSLAWNIPIISVNHLDGHVHAAEINGEPIVYPAIILIASGGHTELVLAKSDGEYQLLGATRDDAAGECFDKAAKLLDLPYPGGPKISKLATTGNTEAIKFPRPMLDSDNFDFSFAGLKTSVLYWLRDNKLKQNGFNLTDLVCRVIGRPRITINDFCASFEQSIIDTLVGKTVKASKEFKPQTVILAGGVAANVKLRDTLAQEISKLKDAPRFRVPEIKYCMDNAAMIAAAGFHLANIKQYTEIDEIRANPNWEI